MKSNIHQRKKNSQGAPAGAQLKNNAMHLQDNRPRSLVQKKQLQEVVQKKEKVAQLSGEAEPDRSLWNVQSYSPATYAHYGAAAIRRVLQAQGLRVRGHASGGAGDAQNQATTDDIAALIAALRADAEARAAAADESEGVAEHKGGGGGGGKRHTKAEQEAAAAKKAEKKKKKAEDKREKWMTSQRGGRGGRGGGAGRGGGRGAGGAGAIMAR